MTVIIDSKKVCKVDVSVRKGRLDCLDMQMGADTADGGGCLRMDAKRSVKIMYDEQMND